MDAALGVHGQGCFHLPRRIYGLHALLCHDQFHFHRPLPLPLPSMPCLFNIGGEGQAYIGGLGAVACSACGWLDKTHALVRWSCCRWPMASVSAVVWCALGVHSRVSAGQGAGSHIVITTIMFNFIAASVMPDGSMAGPLMLKPLGQMSPQTPKVCASRSAAVGAGTGSMSIIGHRDLGKLAGQPVSIRDRPCRLFRASGC